MDGCLFPLFSANRVRMDPTRNDGDRKSVRFAANLCSFNQGAILDVEDVDSAGIWYQASEMKRIRTNAIALAFDTDQRGRTASLMQQQFSL